MVTTSFKNRMSSGSQGITSRSHSRSGSGGSSVDHTSRNVSRSVTQNSDQVGAQASPHGEGETDGTLSTRRELDDRARPGSAQAIASSDSSRRLVNFDSAEEESVQSTPPGSAPAPQAAAHATKGTEMSRTKSSFGVRVRSLKDVSRKISSQDSSADTHPPSAQAQAPAPIAIIRNSSFGSPDLHAVHSMSSIVVSKTLEREQPASAPPAQLGNGSSTGSLFFPRIYGHKAVSESTPAKLSNHVEGRPRSGSDPGWRDPLALVRESPVMLGALVQAKEEPNMRLAKLLTSKNPKNWDKYWLELRGSACVFFLGKRGSWAVMNKKPSGHGSQIRSSSSGGSGAASTLGLGSSTNSGLDRTNTRVAENVISSRRRTSHPENKTNADDKRGSDASQGPARSQHAAAHANYNIATHISLMHPARRSSMRSKTDPVDRVFGRSMSSVELDIGSSIRELSLGDDERSGSGYGASGIRGGSKGTMGSAAASRRERQLRRRSDYVADAESMVATFCVFGCIVERKRIDMLKIRKGADGAPLFLRFNSVIECDLWEEALSRLAQQTYIGISDFNLIAPLGAGAVAKVFLVSERSSGKRYALKVISKAHAYDTQQEYKHAVGERLSLQTVCGYPYFVQLRHAFQTRTRLYLATDFYEGGDMQQFLSKRLTLSLPSARLVAAQLVSCLEILHSHNFLYRDLKPDNILIDAAGHIRLADFGVCKQIAVPSISPTAGSAAASVGDEYISRTICGTLSYAAPEMLALRGYSYSVDFWSLGVVLYVLVVGSLPLDDDKVMALVQRIKYAAENHSSRDEGLIYADIQTPDITFPPDCDISFKHLVQSLMIPNPQERERGGFAEFKKHAFFDGVDWSDIDSSSPSAVPELKEYVGGGKDELRNFDVRAWKHLVLEPDEEDTTYGDISLWPPSATRKILMEDPMIAGFTYSFAP
ncbi:Serine/threonine-protein kinase Sgk1 [Porphyridium purpureum]|uniref:non-specific serine/threonine protein kinase n=1 Tax=Porphyridium purpureum TaxID=35688 RepID=A0A5J4YJ17_PORPP|nr:Serine/threonine-protein kinase Sgk1 [Porphyridium purpureum]|eukprot:POR5170..scf210_14